MDGVTFLLRKTCTLLQLSKAYIFDLLLNILKMCFLALKSNLIFWKDLKQCCQAWILWQVKILEDFMDFHHLQNSVLTYMTQLTRWSHADNLKTDLCHDLLQEGLSRCWSAVCFIRRGHPASLLSWLCPGGVWERSSRAETYSPVPHRRRQSSVPGLWSVRAGVLHIPTSSQSPLGQLLGS